jgi:tRNA pseudouridine38-40 synthase
VRDALNAHLRPHPIAILSAERVADDFNARTSAIRRRYLYRIVNRRADLTLDAGRAWRVPRPLDTDAMHKPRSCSSASTISRPSARPNVRPSRR